MFWLDKGNTGSEDGFLNWLKVDGGGGSNGAAVAGAVTGSIALAGIAGFAVYYFVFLRKKKV